jgi:hypothetical protein
MQHHVRRFVPIPKCGRIRATAPSCSVMNPRPQLALPFAHRRRLLLISRRLYHAACRTARLARLRPCHTLPTAPCQCHPGPTSDGLGIVADPPLQHRLVSFPYLTSPRTPGTGIAAQCTPREPSRSVVLDNDMPLFAVLAHSESLPTASSRIRVLPRLHLRRASHVL